MSNVLRLAIVDPDLMRNPFAPPQFDATGQIVQIVVGFLFSIIDLLVIFGAWDLHKTRSYGFAMAGSVPTGAIIAHWFVARRARAMSIAMTWAGENPTKKLPRSSPRNFPPRPARRASEPSAAGSRCGAPSRSAPGTPR